MISLAHHNSIIGGFVAVRDGQDGFFPLLECADGQGQQLGPVLGGLEAVLAFVLRHPGEDPVRLLHGREDIGVFQGSSAVGKTGRACSNAVNVRQPLVLYETIIKRPGTRGLPRC